MPATTHIVPFAAISGMTEFLQATKTTLALPGLGDALAKQGLTASDWLRLPEGSHRMPHEQALLNTAWPGSTPERPWALAALIASNQGHALQAGQGWALMAPSHLHITTDSISLLNPAALALSNEHNQQLLNAIQKLWADDGLQLQLLPNGVWLAQADWLQGLSLPSIDRAINQDVRELMPNFRQTQTLQRLQTEAQMLLYNHAVNDARAAQRQAGVNALWVWGTGYTPDAQESEATQTIVVHDSLRNAALQGDYYGWHEAWTALDQQLSKALQEAAGNPADFELILCGDNQAVSLTLQKPSLWSRLSQSVTQWRSQDPVLGLLQQL